MQRKRRNAAKGLRHANRPVVPRPLHKQKSTNDSVLALKETQPCGVTDKIRRLFDSAGLLDTFLRPNCMYSMYADKPITKNTGWLTAAITQQFREIIKSSICLGTEQGTLFIIPIIQKRGRELRLSVSIAELALTRHQKPGVGSQGVIQLPSIFLKALIKNNRQGHCNLGQPNFVNSPIAPFCYRKHSGAWTQGNEKAILISVTLCCPEQSRTCRQSYSWIHGLS